MRLFSILVIMFSIWSVFYLLLISNKLFDPIRHLFFKNHLTAFNVRNFALNFQILFIVNSSLWYFCFFIDSLIFFSVRLLFYALCWHISINGISIVALFLFFRIFFSSIISVFLVSLWKAFKSFIKTWLSKKIFNYGRIWWFTGKKKPFFVKIVRKLLKSLRKYFWIFPKAEFFFLLKLFCAKLIVYISSYI